MENVKVSLKIDKYREIIENTDLMKFNLNTSKLSPLGSLIVVAHIRLIPIIFINLYETLHKDIIQSGHVNVYKDLCLCEI